MKTPANVKKNKPNSNPISNSTGGSHRGIAEVDGCYPFDLNL